MAGFGGGGGGLNVQGATVHFYGNATNLNQTINQVQNRVTQFNQLNQTLNNTLNQTFNVRLPPPPKPPDYDWKSMLSSASQANFAFTGLMDRVNAFSGLGPNVSMVWEAFASGGPVLGVVSGVLAGVNVYLNTMVSTFQAGMKALAIGAAGAVAGISFLAYELLNLGGQFEKTQTSYRVFTGSVEKGNELFRQVRALAVVTPFTAMELHRDTETLLAMGVAGEEVVGVLGRLGDIASGDEDRLRRLSLVFGQVMAEGRLSGRRMLQLATLGVGYEDIGKALGVSAHEVKEMAKDGELGVNALIAAINMLTSVGGRFYGMNIQQSRTLRGQWSNLVDVAQDLGGQLGKSLILRYDIAGGVGRIGALVFSNMENIAKAVTTLFDHIYVVGERTVMLLAATFDSLGAALGGAIGNMGDMSALEKTQQIADQVIEGLITGAEFLSEAFFKSAEIVANVLIPGLIKVVELFAYLRSDPGINTKFLGDSGHTPEWVQELNRNKGGDPKLDALIGQAKQFAGVMGDAVKGITESGAIGRGFDDIRNRFRNLQTQTSGGPRYSFGPFGLVEEVTNRIEEKSGRVLEYLGKMNEAGQPLYGRMFEFMSGTQQGQAIQATGGIGKYLFEANREEVARQESMLIEYFQALIDKDPVKMKWEILPEAQKIADALNKTIRQGTDSALGKFKHEMGLINLVYSAGVIGQEEYELGAANAFQDLQKAVKTKGETHTAGAAAFGTQQAADAIAKAQGGAQDTLVDVLGVLQEGKRQADEAQVERRRVSGLLEALNRKGVVVVPGEVAP